MPAMNRSAKFWSSMVVFQVLFGLAVFGLTRQYYLQDHEEAAASPTVAPEEAFDWVTRIPQTGQALLESPASNNPVELTRQADEYFSNQQYDQAARLYERLLAIDGNNVVLHNNLGITLHYLGRSSEALDWLNQGIAIDPANQRIWLTLGYVNSQLGNVDEARSALMAAVEMGPDSQVGQTAARMLEGLPAN